MAPEMLVESLDPNSAERNSSANNDAILFEGFKMADIYSFSLVLWEINRRTRSSDKKVKQLFLINHT